MKPCPYCEGTKATCVFGTTTTQMTCDTCGSCGPTVPRRGGLEDVRQSALGEWNNSTKRVHSLYDIAMELSSLSVIEIIRVYNWVLSMSEVLS